MNLECHQVMKHALTIGLLCACSASALASDGSGSEAALAGAKESLGIESNKLESILQRQSEEDVAARDWEERRARDAQLRAMYREAVLLSELNVAWIEDQLDHWDCRVAEQAGTEVQFRQAELSDYTGKLQTLCAQVGQQDAAQQRVCRTQAEQIAQAQQDLKELAQRYEGECATDPVVPTQAPVGDAEERVQ